MTYSREAVTEFNGLTIVMSNPSRFDKENLITGQIEELYEKILNSCGMSLLGCDITLNGELEELNPKTKCILIHGQGALGGYKERVTLKEQRGSPFEFKEVRPDGEVLRVPAICTFDPQDSIDMQNWEAIKNPLLDGEDTDNDGSEDLKSTHGATRRKNYLFWFQHDIRKACRYVKDGWHPHTSTKFIIQPSAQYAIDALTSNKGKYFYLDIETDTMLNLTCWAFSFLPKGFKNATKSYVPRLVICVPFYDYQGAHSYSKLATCKTLQALAIALRDNTVVCHNCLFDLWIIAFKYRISPGPLVEDTMLMHHRCFSEKEKSLGHAISYWTDQEYHKNEGVFEPQNFSQQQALRLYNGKDVESMILVHQAIKQYTRKDKGLQNSIEQVNDSVRPYLLLNLTGYRMDLSWLKDKISMNDRLMMQYLRVIEMLAGYEINPGSSDQVGAYLISLGVALAKEQPTNERNLYKYMLKQNLPLLRVVIKYRGLRKETGVLKFRRFNGIGKI